MLEALAKSGEMLGLVLFQHGQARLSTSVLQQQMRLTGGIQYCHPSSADGDIRTGGPRGTRLEAIT